MNRIEFLDDNGTFRLEGAAHVSDLYFPLAGESGMKSSITPLLGGDAKTDQNTFLLQPVSVEELHSLRATRNFWVLTQEGPWSLTGVSARAEALMGTPEEETLTVTAGLLWHRTERISRELGLTAKTAAFVPRTNTPAEVLAFTLVNSGDRPRTVTPVSAVPLYGRSADNLRDHRHVTSLLHRALVTHRGVELTPTLTFDERGHRLGEKTFFAWGAADDGAGPQAVCADVHDFLGEGGTFTRPGALFEYDDAAPCWQRPGGRVDGREVLAGLRFPPVTLAPGEEKTWVLALGVTDTKDLPAAREELSRRVLAPGAWEAALQDAAATWLGKVNVRCRTGDKDFDSFMVWVSVQPILRRLFGCSFLPYHDYGKGGRGWRDLWQDCLALLLMDPGEVRGMLLNHYRGVRFDGTNATIIGEGPGEFKADRNGIPRVWMDHGYWPWLTTRLYLHQTGDLALLGEEIPWFKDGQISRCQERDGDWSPDQGTELKDAAGAVVRSTVLEHLLLQNLTAFYDVGEHNILRLRGADWNDGLDMAAARGESVAFTAAYAGNFADLADLLRRLAQTGRPTLTLSAELLPLTQTDPACWADPAAKVRVLEAFHQSCRHTVSGEKAPVDALALADTLQAMGAWLGEHLRTTQWVETQAGAFFNGYYDDSGRQVEGDFPTGVRMTLTGQVFPLLSGVATEEQIDAVIAAADALLWEEKAGGYRLNTDFHEVKTDLGRAFGFAYGHKENGAVFAHMVTMYANALYRRGRGLAGYKALHQLYAQAADFPVSRCYPGLPEYFDGRGRGLYPYLTGSASWYLLTVITEMFGVRGQWGDLKLAPALAADQLDGSGRARLELEFDGIPLGLTYTAAGEGALYTAVSDVTVNGVPVPGDCIPRSRLTPGPTGRVEITARVSPAASCRSHVAPGKPGFCRV